MARQQVLILGGRGRIGHSVADDLLRHTQAVVVITGRRPAAEVAAAELDERLRYCCLDLADREGLEQAIASSQVVVHCAGPFHYRDETVLDLCIHHGINYVDVSDCVSYTRKMLARREAAQQAGVTAVVNTGIFPGISNSMVRQCVEQLDDAEEIHLSYVVSGSGGAGLTVMRTTFLGLMHPFPAWVNGQWVMVTPYSDRQLIQLPAPYGNAHVYWYEMPETLTLAETFAVKTVVTKFGSIPDFYNHLTWIAAHIFPKSWIRSKFGTEFLPQVSYLMTRITDPWSGIGVGIRAEVKGSKNGHPKTVVATLVHDNTAIAAGAGTGSIVALLLNGELRQPGVWAVEAVLPTPQFEATMRDRQIHISACC